MKTNNLLDRRFRPLPKFAQNFQKFQVQCFDRQLDACWGRLRVYVQRGRDVFMPKLGLGIFRSTLPLHKCSKGPPQRLAGQGVCDMTGQSSSFFGCGHVGPTSCRSRRWMRRRVFSSGSLRPNIKKMARGGQCLMDPRKIGFVGWVVERTRTGCG